MSQTNPVLEAVNIITDSKLKNLKFDKTIIATIKDIVDPNQGKYRIEYEAGSFYAYTDTEVYSKGESVYVNIPEGDYSNKKFITGRVSNIEENVLGVDLTNILNYSDRIFTFEPTNSLDKYQIQAPDNYEIFKEYLQVYSKEYFKMTTNFSFSDSIENLISNYGIQITFDGEIVMEMNIADMNGSIFAPTGEQQVKLFQIPDNTYENIDNFNIKFFFTLQNEELYKYDYRYDNKEIEFTDKRTNTIVNIFKMPNIELEPASIADLSSAFYHLEIHQLDTSPIVLQGQLYHEGKLITAQQCEWYLEDREAGYDEKLGYFWKKLDENSNILTLNNSFYHKIKLLAYYSDNDYIDTTFHINYKFKINAEIIIEDDGTKNIKIDNVIFPLGEFEKWIALLTPDGNNISIRSDWSPYPFLVICLDYVDVNEKTGGTIVFTWENTKENIEPRIRIQGQYSFHYNFDGNIFHNIDTEKEYILRPEYSGNGKITQINWYITHGINEETINDTKGDIDTLLYSNNNRLFVGKIYKPHHSMFKEIWVDNKGNVHFKIQDTYYSDAYNNILRAKCYVIPQNKDKGKYIYQTQEIYFIKEGEQGTAGTYEYYAIRPVNQYGEYINDEEAILRPKHPLYLKLVKYEDGQEVKISEDIVWTKSVNVTKGMWINEVEADHTMVQIEIGDGNYIGPLNYYFIDAKPKEDFHCKYPIYVSQYDNKYDYLELPKFIHFSGEGRLPQWYNKPILCFSGGQRRFSKAYSLSTYPSLITIDNDKQKVSPTTEQFTFEYGIGVVYFGEDEPLFCPIMMYLDYYNSNIPEWDGTTIKTSTGEQLVPQVGVGSINNTNGYYSGILMSQNADSSGGLYGYDENGYNSFSLNSDGTAYFKEIGIRDKYTGENKGIIGIYTGNNGSDIVGIKSDKKSIALESSNTIRLSAPNASIYNESKEFNITASADKIIFPVWTDTNGITYLDYTKISDIILKLANLQSQIDNIKTNMATKSDIQNLQTQIDNLNKSDE